MKYILPVLIVAALVVMFMVMVLPTIGGGSPIMRFG